MMKQLKGYRAKDAKSVYLEQCKIMKMEPQDTTGMSGNMIFKLAEKDFNKGTSYQKTMWAAHVGYIKKPNILQRMIYRIRYGKK